MANQATNRPTISTPRAFTLLEGLVAVGILLVIILFVGKIFSSVSDVTATGQANADAITEVAAFEEQLRADFERLARDGYLVIESVAVRNDVNDPSGADPRLWLNPDLAPDAVIRSDRLVFFRNGVSTTQIFRAGQDDDRLGQSAVSRVYYGHGFQLLDNVAPADNVTQPIDEEVDPWDEDIEVEGSNQLIIQPPARKWTLARQNVLLADDGDGSVFMFAGTRGGSTGDIWTNDLRNSRVDAAASDLANIRQQVLNVSAGNLNDWDEQRSVMLDSLFVPRAERGAATMQRSEHATTTSVLGSAVSDFIVEWTYADNTGRTPDPNNPGNVFPGVDLYPDADFGDVPGPQPWFGLSDDVILSQLDPDEYVRRDVFALGDGDPDSPQRWRVNAPVLDGSGMNPIELLDTSEASNGVVRYFAVFGYNTDQPLVENPGDPDFGLPVNETQLGDAGVPAHTPLPDAIRITMRVHDPNTRLTSGRLVQFVIDLPDRR